jgi:3-deoxy-manno-octulosonate cytidylyltransferase (CMP-KDO synthetase)
VLIATDSEEIMEFAHSLSFPAVFTPEDCASGSDRVYAVAQSIAADIYVNIQGDEPLLRPEHLDALLEPMERAEVEVTTLSTPCAPHLIHNPNAVKVVVAADGRALYFSRAAIPHDRDGIGNVPYQKHLGFYAYRKSTLDLFPELPPSRLEIIERLEQLRFLENGIHVYVTSTPFDTIGVDTEEDLLAAEQELRKQ